MAKPSDDAPKEIGPSDEKGEKGEPKAPRRARFHVLAAVGAATLAVAAIAVTTWALANRGDATAGPDTDQATSESGTSSASPTYWATYGPTLPGTPSTLPTLPTPNLDDDPVPSSPLTFPTPSTSATPYTPPAYTPSTYTPPTYTPSTTTPTTPTTTPTTTPPARTKVWPVEPRATKINGRCGTFGSLRIVKTTGVRYVLKRGDGREGKWVVTASARKGYVIAAGATTRFSGNLGKHRPCPGDPYISQVSSTPTEDPEADQWDVAVTTVVPGKEPRELGVTYTFSTEVDVISSTSNGWSCEGGDQITCTFDYVGKAPPAVTLRLLALEEGEPHGGVTLASDGTIYDTDVF